MERAVKRAKERRARGFKGIQIKDLAKLFKRKKIQPPTPSGVKGAAAGAAATKSQGEASKTKSQTKGGNVTGGNRAGSPGSTKNPITPKVEEKAPVTKQQRVGGRNKKSGPAASAAQQQRIQDEIASLKTKIKNTTSGKVRGKLQRKLESLQAKLK